MRIALSLRLKLIFAAGCVLRFALCLVNREANDDHISLIRGIFESAGNPISRWACRECFHPRFYHSVSAWVFQIFSLHQESAQYIAAQMVNFCAAVAFLLLLAWLLTQYPAFDWVKTIGFAFLALNPDFISIQSQATNDAFVILFSTLAIFWLVRFMESFRLSEAVFSGVSLVLATMSKASGWIVFFCVLAVLAIRWVSFQKDDPHRRTVAKGVGLIAVLFFLIVPFTPPYLENIKEFRTPFVPAQEEMVKPAPPKFFEETTESIRPGVASVWSAFFTFRWSDLIRYPWTSTGPHIGHISRTSFWSQIYGRLYFMRFSQWPQSWETSNQGVRWLGRFAMVFGMVPTVVFFLGLGAALLQIPWSRPRLLGDYFRTNKDWPHFIFGLAMLAMVLKLTYDYRDFGWMKAIYLFPATLSYFWFFLLGLKQVNTEWRMITGAAFFVLFLIFITDAVILICQLA